MAKSKTQYVCQNCGVSSPRWLGRCSSCGEWNTLVEEVMDAASAATKENSLQSIRDSFSGSERGEYVALEETGKGESPGVQRLPTGIGELDRVLGGGLVRDSFVLLGGDPGVGKSTLLLQMAGGVQAKVLYASGEESVEQIRARAERLGIEGQGRLFLAAETQLEQVLAMVKELEPQVLVMDSLQTFSTCFLESAPGSVGQVREVAARLMTLAKSAGVAVWLVGHVTKDGSIAGPKTVEHMVDTVLYFEGEGNQSYRIVRAVKNRFGNARELGVFEMAGEGLMEVKNPSAAFLNDRKSAAAGTAISACIEGTRPILVELQALVAGSPLAVPRRTSVGVDGNRVALLAAIIEKHMHVPLGSQDLFFNVAGGLRLSEPACDLACAAAIWSSAKDIAVPADLLIMGEVGLTGEVRSVSLPEVRLAEARKLGFKRAIIPNRNIERCRSLADGIRLDGISRLAELRELLN